MAIIDKQGKLFGRINVIDFVFVSTVCLAVMGVLLVQSGLHVTSGQVVQGETDILIAVQVPNLKTLDSALFKPGQKTAITIRNQPRGQVLIEDVKSEPVKITLPSPTGQAQSIPDPSQANGYDYTLWLKDHAKVTEDGYVTEGVKVKIGLPIELEGFKYRVYGKIVDVKPLP